MERLEGCWNDGNCPPSQPGSGRLPEGKYQQHAVGDPTMLTPDTPKPPVSQGLGYRDSLGESLTVAGLVDQTSRDPMRRLDISGPCIGDIESIAVLGTEESRF